MDEGHHDRLAELFERAVDLPAEARDGFIDSCTDDGSIRAELRSLIAAHDRAPDLLERLARQVMPGALEAVSVAALSISPGARIGTYQIERRLAAGGIGVVYRAFDTMLQRPIAIKTLALRTPDARESLLREARAASALNHPHICTIYEVGEHEGCPFIAMEYIDGTQLGELIPKDGMPAESIVRFGIQLARAVEHAYRHGVVHRDLKSANALVNREGLLKVLDFGLASRLPSVDVDTLTRTSDQGGGGTPLAGTLPYLAPELLRGGAADGRSDVWALGVMFHEMASGRLPFEGATPFELTAAILDAIPRELSAKVPIALRAVINRCLERDPTQRYQHGGEVRIALETLQLGREPARVAREERRSHERTAWWRRPLTIAGAVALLIAAAAAIVSLQARRAPALTGRDTLLVADFINTTGDAVFDGALTQALSLHLEQSPFLSVVSRDQVRDTLRLMTKAPEERVVNDVAREVCQRLGAKAALGGSIGPIGSHFVIAVNALNCQSGETIAGEQAEAEKREKVLDVLSAMTSRLRQKLGESLQSIQRFDTPISQATTSSLDALKAFSVGEEIRGRSGEFDSLAFYKRGIELDPNFALAYARIASVYGNLGQAAESRRMNAEAYARRERVSERERFYIDGGHCAATGDLDCYRNVHELWARTYPRDGMPHGNLSAVYFGQGRCEQALEHAQAAVRRDPGFSQPYGFLARSQLCVGRVVEARRTLDEAIARHLESPFLYLVLFHVAFLQRDERALTVVRHWADGRAEDAMITDLDADGAAYDGRMRRSRELRLRAEQLAAPHLSERIATSRARSAFYEAAHNDVARARASMATVDVDSIQMPELVLLMATAVLAGDRQRADALFAKRDQRPPRAVLIEPLVRALHDVDRGHRSSVERLPGAVTEELAQGQSFRPAYIRGLIYLRVGDGSRAATEFQRILDNRTRDAVSPLYPLAYVQQARAFSALGELARARKAYESFFALWKDGDKDIPILREARNEYARLTVPEPLR